MERFRSRSAAGCITHCERNLSADRLENTEQFEFIVGIELNGLELVAIQAKKNGARVRN